MISVKVKYYKRKVKIVEGAQISDKEDFFFIYTHFEVSGHCNLGKTYDNLVCSAITSILAPIPDMLWDDPLVSCFCERGHFKYESMYNGIKHNFILKQDFVRNNMHLDTCLYQLYNLYCNYPSEFSCFEMIDIKKGEK